MSDLSVFIDESGSQEGGSSYYIVTYVLHDQSDDILGYFARYSESFSKKGLADIPFHANPLMRGNDAYSNMSIEDRKKLLIVFNMAVQKLPIRYKSFAYMSKRARVLPSGRSILYRFSWCVSFVSAIMMVDCK